MRLSRRFVGVCIAAAIALSSAPATASAEPGEWRLKGRMVDSLTGGAANGMSVVAYAYNRETGRWLAYSAYESSGGRFEVGLPNYCEPVVLWMSGNSRYYETYYDGVHATKTLLTGGESTPPDAFGSLTADMRKAKKIYQDSDSVRDLGAVRVDNKPVAYGMIAGRVTEKYSGKGFPGYRVDRCIEDPATGEWIPDGGTENIASDGSYVLRATTPVNALTVPFKLRFKFWTPSGYVESWYPGGSSAATARVLKLTTGDIVDDIDMEIAIPGRLRGTVMSTRSKAPVDDAGVDAFRQDASGDWDFAASDHSSSSGAYALKDTWALAPGNYKIRVLDRSTRPYGYFYYGQYRSLGNAREVSLTAGDVVSGLDVWMGDDPAIAGRVVENGLPKADIRVEAYQKRAGGAWVYVGADYSDTAGRYRVMCPEAGTYTLKFVDLAGTSAPGDDVARFLGAAQSIEDASTRTVLEDRTRALDDIEIEEADEARVTRVAGTSPYAAAIAASKATFPAEQSSAAVLASGARYSEALCAAGLAGAVDGPVLLTGEDRLYKGVLPEFDRLGVRDVYILGNDAMVSRNQDRLLKALGYNVIRISGKDRFEVSANVARKTATLSTITSETPVFVVSGWTRADALAAGPIAYRHKGLMLLTDRNVTPSTVKSAVIALGVKRAYAIGRYEDLPSGSVKGLRDAGVTVERLATSTSSYTRGAQVLAAAEARGWGSPSTIALAPGPSLGECVTAGASAGRAGGAVLFARPTELTDATAAAIRARSASVTALTAYARSTSIRTSVLVKAGSQ